MKGSDGEIGVEQKIMRVILLLKLELPVIGNRGASTEEEAEGGQRTEGA